MFAATAGVTAAATSEIWVPVLISGVVGVASSIGAFFIGRAVNQPNNTQRNLHELRAKQVKRDIKTRQEANHLAQDTKKEVEAVIDQSKKQQRQVELHNNNLGQKITAVQDETKKLDRTTTALRQTAAISTDNMTQITQELEQLRTELTAVNQQLRHTQDQLVNKERDLSGTLTSLAELQQQLAAETLNSTQRLRDLTQQLAEVTGLLQQPAPGIAVKDTELVSLRSENARMALTIQTLESTVARYSATLKTSKQSSITQLTEIRRLIGENKQLNTAISELSKHFDDDEKSSDDTKGAKANPRRSVRMFST